MSESRSSVSDDRVSVALSKFGGAQSRGTGSGSNLLFITNPSRHSLKLGTRPCVFDVISNHAVVSPCLMGNETGPQLWMLFQLRTALVC